MPELKNLKGLAEKDRKLIEDAETLLGPEPSSMGFVKNLFWGNVREELVFPYLQSGPEETARCDALLASLDAYLENEHPAVQIDQEQEIPNWVIERLFSLGVLGMTIPGEYGGGGLGIASYNRALEHIGRYCGSTAVMVSAHQSIGCKAIMLFGTEEQKSRWLPHLATDWLSAFCLSEPNVGCDAGGQETRCELSEDGQYYILNGEKKWSTSAALSRLFTVMAKQKLHDPKTGKTSDKVTALVCMPDMPGVDIFEKNRSKCGIRGTWQARIRFRDVRVPRSHLLHQEGKGLNVALSCLNYGRCTLSAGMLGGATRAFEQSTKWAQTRFQFQRPLADFELVRAKIARMAALTYAMDAVLYQTCGMLDRHDEDIMLETAVCKLFCSEMGWRVVNDALQIMGGEGYMTENQIERIFRDSRINLIVEGANEVMQSFIFAYGGKQLAEKLLGIQQAVGWDHHDSPTHNLARIPARAEAPGGGQGRRPAGRRAFPGLPPRCAAYPAGGAGPARLCRAALQAGPGAQSRIQAGQPTLRRADRLAPVRPGAACRQHHVAPRLGMHAQQAGPGPAHAPRDAKFERDKAAAKYFFDMAETEVRNCFRDLMENNDESMLAAANAALTYSNELPNSRFVIPEKSPIARGTGRPPSREGIKQFPGDVPVSGNEPGGNGRVRIVEELSTVTRGRTPAPGTPGEGRGGGLAGEPAASRPPP